jgi:hypothetical protein
MACYSSHLYCIQDIIPAQVSAARAAELHVKISSIPTQMAGRALNSVRRRTSANPRKTKEVKM